MGEPNPLQYSTYSGISWILSSSDLTTWHFKDYFGHFERVDYLIASSENVALILLPTASVIPINSEGLFSKT